MRLNWDHLPPFLREKIAHTKTQEQLVKVYLKLPPKIQYLLARYGVRIVVNKKRAELQEFMRH